MAIDIYSEPQHDVNLSATPRPGRLTHCEESPPSH